MTVGNCIYCKETARLTKEHVMPKALGGNVKPPLVCDECRLSELDQALAEDTPLSMSRVGYTQPGTFPVKLGGSIFKYDEKYGLYVEVAVVNRMTPVPLPQLHFRLQGELVDATLYVESEEARDGFIAFLDERHDEGALQKLHVTVGPSDVCTSARIVMHRSDDAFMRAATEAEGRMFLERFAMRWNQGVRESLASAQVYSFAVEQPKVNIRLSICPDDEYRAVAKIAFNVLAMDFGSEYALRSEFDLIREYIRGRDIRHPEPRADDEVAVDHRFVRSLEPGTEPFVPTEGHVVAFFNRPPNLFAWVTLYRSHDYLVRLGAVASPRLEPWCREFSISRDGSEVLSIDEVWRRQSNRSAPEIFWPDTDRHDDRIVI